MRKALNAQAYPLIYIIMKAKVFFLFAALSSVSLMSCSNDNEPEATATNNALLNVVVEELQYEDMTRAAYLPVGNKLYWQNGDGIKVYDNKLLTNDEYTFDSAKRIFSVNTAATNIDGDITYALSPSSIVDYSGWTPRGIRAVIYLQPTIVYDETTENTTIVDGQTLYAAKLPMWGTATGTFGNVMVNLKYLCAVMKLKVNKSKATFVKIASATMPLSGGVEAVIAKNGVIAGEPTIKEGTGALGSKNYVILDLRQMPSAEGYVYVPIIPDTYDDLKVLYTTLDVPVGTNLTNDQITDKDEKIWTLQKAYPEGKQIKRNTVYLVNM